MKRTVKFRGISKTSNEWGYGSLVDLGAVGTFIVPEGSVLLSPDRLIEVIPESVGQFTSIYDKESREIYEGDVALYEKTHFDWDKEDGAEEYLKTHIGEVVFRSGCFEHSKSDFGWEGEELKPLDKCLIIGNIFQNPELIQNEEAS